MHVQYSMPRHRASRERQLWEEEVEEEERDGERGKHGSHYRDISHATTHTLAAYDTHAQAEEFQDILEKFGCRPQVIQVNITP